MSVYLQCGIFVMSLKSICSRMQFLAYPHHSVTFLTTFLETMPVSSNARNRPNNMLVHGITRLVSTTLRHHKVPVFLFMLAFSVSSWVQHFLRVNQPPKCLVLWHGSEPSILCATRMVIPVQNYFSQCCCRGTNFQHVCQKTHSRQRCVKFMAVVSGCFQHYCSVCTVNQSQFNWFATNHACRTRHVKRHHYACIEKDQIAYLYIYIFHDVIKERVHDRCM